MRWQEKQHLVGAITGIIALLWLAGCSALTTPGNSTIPQPAGTPVKQGTVTPIGGNLAWASSIVASTTGRQNPLVIENLNPFSGKRVAITSLPTSDLAVVDGVSPNGTLIAFHIFDSQHHATYSVASIDGNTAPHVVGQFADTLGNAVWRHDNAHLAVTTGQAIMIFGFDGAPPIQIVNVHAAGLLGFAPDDSALFYIGGDAVDIVPGALYRLPLSDPQHPLQLTPRQISTHFLLSRDGAQVFYQNSGPSGVGGIYRAPTNMANAATLLHSGVGIPVGFATDGALLVAASQNNQVSLTQLGSASQQDILVSANLIGSGTTLANVAQDIVVAPDGNAVMALATPTSGGFTYYLTDLTAPTKAAKLALSLPSASRADLPGFDTVIMPGGS